MTHSDFPTPGLQIRTSATGAKRFVWVAQAKHVKRGYEPKTVRLHYAEDQREMISTACQKLQAEMLLWVSKLGAPKQPSFDGTVADLVRRYERDAESPYQRVKWTTRRLYDNYLGKIERVFGERTLASLKLGDFRRWYDEARKPPKPGAPEQIRKAHGIISMVRRIVAYGVAAEIAHCARLHGILAVTQFEQPERRRQKLELAHVQAVIVQAITENRVSIALGTAIQFETAMRQRDVIGEWEPITPGAPRIGIVLGRRRWVNGLTWADISKDLELYKITTKTGATAAHDLKLCPIVLEIMELVPRERRVGPVILDEMAGRPYAEWQYAREWRRIARLSGVPDEIWNMDARAGGISEADDAGADIDLIRAAATHTQVSTTSRYIRHTIGKSQQVARLRAAHRKKETR